MLLAISFVGISLALFSQYGAEGVFASTLLSLGTGGLALFAGPEHRNEILRTITFSFVGCFIGSAMSPMGAYGSLPAQAIPVAMGIIGCSAFGSLAYRENASEKQDAE
ncbi:MAG: hypothetical protein AAF623_16355 [Planctomycetota bacterium]